MASDFSPADSLSFSWKDSSSQPLQDSRQYPLLEQNGVNVGFSEIRVTAEDWEKKKPYQCTVTHPALSGDKTVILEKPDPPSVPTNKPCLDLTLKSPRVIELFINNKAVLDCIISGRDKGAVEQAEVTWKVDHAVTTVNVNTASGAWGLKGRFVRNSTLTLSGTSSKGTIIECQVQQKGGSPISETLTIGQERQSPPTVSIAIPADLNKMTDIMLACLVTDFSPSEIYVAWQVENGGYEAGITGEPVATGEKFSVTSLLKVSKVNWNKSTTYSCIARHGSQEQQKVPAIKTVNKKTEKPRVPTPEQDHLDTCNCNEEVPHKDEYNSLWNTAFSFIILFLTSLTILGFNIYHTHLKVI
uniref:Ig-like domain-containing protein n=1 Tax=Paramormyrops kingsleyae TaxID=1676925 RepID=A0A3B3RQ80_9TELE